MDSIDRRRLLIGGAAGALGIAAAALGPITALADQGEGGGPVGTWDLQITDATAQGGPSTFEGATTFNPGGGVINMDSGSPATGLGSWSGGEKGAFKARFMQFGFSSFNPSDGSTVKLVVTIKGKRSGNAISGTFTYVVYALNGTVIFPNGAGTFTGTRFAAA
jgi:hypothetical protein